MTNYVHVMLHDITVVDLHLVVYITVTDNGLTEQFLMNVIYIDKFSSIS